MLPPTVETVGFRATICMDIITKESTETIRTVTQMIRIRRYQYICKKDIYSNDKLVQSDQYVDNGFKAYKPNFIHDNNNYPDIQEWGYIIENPFDYAIENGIDSMIYLKCDNYNEPFIDIDGKLYSQMQFDGYYSEKDVDIDRMYNIIKDIATFTDNKPFFEQDDKRWINAFWYLPTVEQLEIEYYKNRFLEECLK